MAQNRVGGIGAALGALGALLATAAWAALAGIVTGVTPSSITVSKVAYELHDEATILDMTGRPIALGEIRPGIPVEIELDDEGRVVVIRASVVR